MRRRENRGGQSGRREEKRKRQRTNLCLVLPGQEQWLQVDDGRVEDAVARDCCDDEGPPPLFGHTLSWLEEFNTLILIGGCTMSDRFESGQNTTRNGTNSSRKRSDSSSVEKPPVVWHFDLENCHDENNRGKWVAGPVRFCMPNRWYHSATPTPVDDHRSKKAIYVFGGICHTSTPFLSKTSVSISSMSTTSRDSNPSRRNRRKGTALPAGLKTGNKSRLSSNGNATALTKGSASGDTGPDSVNPSVPPSPQFMSPADCWTSVGEVVGELWRLEVPNLSWELVSPTGRQLWQGQEGLTRPLSRCGASLACHNDSLFVFGGFEEHFCQGHGTRRGSTRHNMSERKAAASFLNDLWEFRLLETQWRPVNITGCIPRGRAWCSSGVLNQRLLIFGGEVSSLTVPREKEERRGRQCSEVFEFSFANKRWRQIFTEGQPLPAVSRAAAATIMRSQEIENGEEEEDEEGEGHEEAGENWIMVVCGGTRSVGKTELVYRRTVHLWGRSSVTDGARSLSVVEVLERLAESEAKMRIEVAAVSRQLDDRRAESSEYRELRGDPVVGEAVRSLVTQLQAAKDRRCCVICRDEEIQVSERVSLVSCENLGGLEGCHFLLSLSDCFRLWAHVLLRAVCGLPCGHP